MQTGGGSPEGLGEDGERGTSTWSAFSGVLSGSSPSRRARPPSRHCGVRLGADGVLGKVCHRGGPISLVQPGNLTHCSHNTPTPSPGLFHPMALC